MSSITFSVLLIVEREFKVDMSHVEMPMEMRYTDTAVIPCQRLKSGDLASETCVSISGSNLIGLT